MTTTQTETFRRAYRFLLAYAGESPVRFERACRGLIEEARDGEGEGAPSPAEWVQAALEHAWIVTTKGGRDAGASMRFKRTTENVDAILAGKL